MALTKVLLISCGSFNPPTNMHLRMFEIARDHLQRMGQYTVIGGVISPVHDAYGKKDLVSAGHRCAMLRLALQDSDWIRMSDWECHQSDWSRTKQVLQHHQNQLNSALNANHNSPNKRQKREAPHDEVDDVCQESSMWVPSELARHTGGGPVQVMLLCGADLLESFGKPGLWASEDIETIIGQHGLIVVTREGTNPYKFIYESDVLTKLMSKIVIVTEWITNEVSSTKIRRAVRRGESIKYLVPDAVADYIQRNQLYSELSTGATPNHNKYRQSSGSLPNKNSSFLSPSPKDKKIVSSSQSSSPRIVKIQVKSQENVSRMAEFLGAEFGTFGSESSKSRGRFTENEWALNEENTKRSILGSSTLLPKSSSRDCLDGRKVSLASMPSPKSTKHFRSVDESKGDENEVKVEIKITDDGILVISDKETTV